MGHKSIIMKEVKYNIRGKYYNLMQAINISTSKWEHFLIEFDSNGNEVCRSAIHGVVKEIAIERSKTGPWLYNITLAE